MFKTGFDSMALEKEFFPLDTFLDESHQTNEVKGKPVVLKALVGASITTQDPKFDEHYQNILQMAFDKQHIPQEKLIYKGAHMLKQVSAKFDEIMTDILNELEPVISHIDLYFATYPKPYISIFGKAQGQRLSPMEYIAKHKNAFAHACAWWHWRNYAKTETPSEYHIDYFEGKSTPAWVEMDTNKVNMKTYYSGCECDTLISFADLLLKTIEVFHYGTIDYRSIAGPIWKRSKTFALSQKVKSYNLAKFDWVIRATVPELPLDINLNGYVKHPIYFIAWSPTLPRKAVKKSFEWSKFYNAIIQRAIKTEGCVKLLDFDKDMTFWDDTDFIIPWEPADEEHVRLLSSMGFERMPTILKSSDIVT